MKNKRNTNHDLKNMRDRANELRVGRGAPKLEKASTRKDISLALASERKLVREADQTRVDLAEEEIAAVAVTAVAVVTTAIASAVTTAVGATGMMDKDHLLFTSLIKVISDERGRQQAAAAAAAAAAADVMVEDDDDATAAAAAAAVGVGTVEVSAETVPKGISFEAALELALLVVDLDGEFD